MTTFGEVQRIQAYLRENARQQYEALELPPFTLFFHPTNTSQYFNYAIPDRPAGGELREVLSALRDVFRRRGRIPRCEFFEAFAPALPDTLAAGGFRLESRQWSMVCTPQSIQPVPPVPDLQVVILQPDSPVADIRDFIIAQRQGFNPQDERLPGENELAEIRRDLKTGGWQAYLARAAGQPAGSAVLNRPAEGPSEGAGVSEVAGVATRQLFRRRGIASFLVWQATRAAFESGVQTVCLTAADEQAGQVYRRIGYQPFSIMLAYIDEANEP